MVVVFVAAISLAAFRPASTPTMTTTPATGRAPVNDIQMYYEIHGDGTPLIHLHGGLGNTAHSENQIPVLKNIGHMWASEPNFAAEQAASEMNKTGYLECVDARFLGNEAAGSTL